MTLAYPTASASTGILAADFLTSAHQQARQLTAVCQRHGLAPALVSAKQYQVYARFLLAAVQQPNADVWLEGDQPLPAALTALLQQMQQHVNEEVTLRAPNLSILAASQGEETLRRLLLVLLKSFTESVNVKNRVSLFQLHGMVALLPVEFSDLSVSDLVLCLRQVKAGRYGPLYESFDTVKLGEFLNRYRTEKEELRELRHRQAKCTQSNLLAQIVAQLDTAPPDVQEGIRKLSLPQPLPREGALEQGGFEVSKDMSSQRHDTISPDGGGREGVDFGVDHSDLYREKPKPKHPRPRPLNESEYRQQIQQRLAPYLAIMDAEEFRQAIDYYRQHREEKLAQWLETEQKRRAEGMEQRA